MNKYIFLIFAVAFHSILFSQQYEIVPIGPIAIEGEHHHYSMNGEFKTYPKIYDDGKIIGSINKKAFIYTPENGFNTVDCIHSEKVEPIMMNKNGVMIGKFETGEDNYHIFVYDVVTQGHADIMDHPELKDQSAFYGDLYITDDNKIFASLDFGFSFSYDLNTGDYDFAVKEGFVAANDSGQMVGENWYYSPSAGYIAFNEPFYLREISSKGVVAGTIRQDDPDKEFAFLWDEVNGFNIFEGPGQSQGIWTYGLNDRGSLLGGATTKGGNYPTYRDFFYSKKTGMVELKPLGGDEIYSYSLSNVNEVVGQSTVDKKGYDRHAFIWTPEKGMKKLADLIPKKKGWDQFTCATSINNKGQIVGVGQYKGKDQLYT